MNHSPSGVFALSLPLATVDRSVVEPIGAYDPVEQLWRDEGAVEALKVCKPSLVDCVQDSECCSDVCDCGFCQ